MAADTKFEVVHMLRRFAADKVVLDVYQAIEIKIRLVSGVTDGYRVAHEAPELGMPAGLV